MPCDAMEEVVPCDGQEALRVQIHRVVACGKVAWLDHVALPQLEAEWTPLQGDWWFGNNVSWGLW